MNNKELLKFIGLMLIAPIGYAAGIGGLMVDIVQPVFPIGEVYWRLVVIFILTTWCIGFPWFYSPTATWLKTNLGEWRKTAHVIS